MTKGRISFYEFYNNMEKIAVLKPKYVYRLKNKQGLSDRLRLIFCIEERRMEFIQEIKDWENSVFIMVEGNVKMDLWQVLNHLWTRVSTETTKRYQEHFCQIMSYIRLEREYQDVIDEVHIQTAATLVAETNALKKMELVGMEPGVSNFGLVFENSKQSIEVEMIFHKRSKEVFYRAKGTVEKAEIKILDIIEKNILLEDVRLGAENFGERELGVLMEALTNKLREQYPKTQDHENQMNAYKMERMFNREKHYDPNFWII